MTTLQYHDHAIELCDATTGHAVVMIALCRDTATARMLVDAYNAHDRLEAAINHHITIEAGLRQREADLTAERDELLTEMKKISTVHAHALAAGDALLDATSIALDAIAKAEGK